jgi:hypothetical protein
MTMKQRIGELERDLMDMEANRDLWRGVAYGMEQALKNAEVGCPVELVPALAAFNAARNFTSFGETAEAAKHNDVAAEVQNARDVLALAVFPGATPARHGLAELLTTAARYLEHPDVAAMPFALSSTVIAARLRSVVLNPNHAPVHDRGAAARAACVTVAAGILHWAQQSDERTGSVEIYRSVLDQWHKALTRAVDGTKELATGKQ